MQISMMMMMAMDVCMYVCNDENVGGGGGGGGGGGKDLKEGLF